MAGEAKPGGVDGFFRAKRPDLARITPGSLLTLSLKRPAQNGLFQVPPTAIYDNARIYLLREGRLYGVRINITGSAQIAGESIRLIHGAELVEGDKLVLTRLPNAATGLKVEPIDAAGDD